MGWHVCLVSTGDMPYPGIFAHPGEVFASVTDRKNPFSEKSPAPLRWHHPDKVHAVR
jgi:hypothetical protein